ncbi:hypothetical protein EYC84_005578 [Monilinia fructicola]|uniref:ORC1/DEAH AAA+ ATPase domain-containing protein n=1 Tax=Monilinia fructicola TaxID=38448 RepID=A0A5M9K1N7_MONFR|nr:hypothetical protein EYC84_005578 [Monilinia fructicola]
MIIIDITRKGESNERFHHFEIIVSTTAAPPPSSQQSISLSIEPVQFLSTGPLGIYKSLGVESDWLNAHVRDMLNALKSCTILPATCNETVIIRVLEEKSWDSDGSEDSFPVIRVLWELLERLDLWEPSVQPLSVNVVRTIAAGAIDQPSGDDVNDDCNRTINSANHYSDDDEGRSPKILVLACRAPNSTTTTTLTRPVSDTILAATSELKRNTVTTAESGSGNITFVRPGSYRALKAKLEAHPRGYFTTIHLDMEVVHKCPPKSQPKIYFQFISGSKNESQVIQTELKTASKIGALFALHGVYRVVIVPCPLARSATEAAAATLIKAGMRAVVTLAYPATEKSVELFTSRLYIAHFQQDLDLEEAARVARRGLVQEKANGGGADNTEDTIPVGDFYTACVRRPEVHEWSYHNRQVTYPYGRENDILHIESTILLGDRLPLLLYGPPGTGKTALLSHLHLWWKASGMIDDSAHIHLATTGPFDKDNILHHIQRQLNPDKTVEDTSLDSLHEYLKMHKCLVVLDDLESATFNYQHRPFLNLCSTLSKAGALVVLLSRKREKWLGRATKMYRLAGLPTPPATQMIIDSVRSSHIIDANLSTPLSSRTMPQTEEDKDFLAGIVEMIDGSPLAIKHLIRHSLCRNTAPKSVYLLLLGISLKPSVNLTTPPSILDSAVDTEPLRSVTQLREIFQALLPTKLGEGLLPALLAPFIGLIPYKDLIKVVYIWSTIIRRKLGEDASVRRVRVHLDSPEFLGDGPEPVQDKTLAIKALLDVAETVASRQSSNLDPENDKKQGPSDGIPSASFASAVVFWEDVEFPEQPPALSKSINAMIDRIKDTLVEAGMLEELPTIPSLPTSNDRGLLQVNPLVPLFLRQDENYVNDVFSVTSTVREAFVLYYCYRGKRWPWTYWTTPQYGWSKVGAEIELEFDNFASACVTGFSVVNLDTIKLLALLRIAAALDRGTGESKFYYRKKVVIYIWTLALARIHMTLTKLEAAGLDRRTEQYPFLIMALYFSSKIWEYNDLNNNSEAATAYRRMIAKYAILASTRFPEEKTPEAQRASSQSSQTLRNLAEMAADLSGNIRYISNDIENEIFDRILNPFEASDLPSSSQGTPISLEIDLVAMLSVSAEFGLSTKLTEDARAAAQKGDWATAEESLGRALALELNAEENDCANRARIVSLQALAADGQEQCEKAQQLREEQARLEQLAKSDDDDDDDDDDDPNC